MRYPAPEKLEVIRQVEQSHLSVKQTLGLLGIPVTTFYRWYDRYLSLGEAGPEDRSSRPSRVWNQIPDMVRERGAPRDLRVSRIVYAHTTTPRILFCPPTQYLPSIFCRREPREAGPVPVLRLRPKSIYVGGSPHAQQLETLSTAFFAWKNERGAVRQRQTCDLV